MTKNRSAATKPANAPSGAAASLDSLVARAAEMHRQGHLPEAEALYRDVLTIDPRHADALNLLGVIAHQCGQSAAAVDLIDKAISEKPREPTFHNNVGLALQALGRDEDAIRHFKRAIALKPDYSVAVTNLGLLLLLAGRHEEATNAAAAALAAAETVEAKQLFVECLKMPQDPAKLAPSRAMILRALRERWTRPEDLARLVSRMVSESGALAKAVEAAQSAWPQRLPASALELTHAQSDVLLHALLISTRIGTIALEHYLTNLRSALLEQSLLPGPDDPKIVSLASAIARQCFINEYVFFCTDAEAAQIEGLIRSLASALATDQPVSPLQLAVVAAYSPLGWLFPAETLLGRDWPEPIKDILVQQVQEPDTERLLRASIPRLTPIENSVSRAVRAQYEDHPYPRWAATASMFPSSTMYSSAHDILVAGCGTGRQAIEMALVNKSARILAVDLSLASLSYALRKSRELGVGNLEFAQADILELGTLGRTFDFIDSSGVLHHLADPWTGWRVLISLLKPGCMMRVALYSELARRPVVATREFIAERGYSSSTEDIRRFRQDLLQEPLLAQATRPLDFHTISSCRDLLFHVQEQRMTIPQIKAFLSQNGLDFVGFDVSTTTLQAFRQRFPGEQSESNLDYWHIFEQENPFLFAGMYQFDVRKR